MLDLPPEAEITVTYTAITRPRSDDSPQTLWQPHYQVAPADGQPLPDTLVLMPRLASHAQGVGLLEEISESVILNSAERENPRGEPSWVETATGRQLGRFGWQGTEPSVASQIAVAFAREMGLSNPMIAEIDCAVHDHAWPGRAHGRRAGSHRRAVVTFQQLESVRRPPDAAERLQALVDGGELYERAGCADCHRPHIPTINGDTISPYTDLLLHDLGSGLSDRTVAGEPIPRRWRTAPLWGLSTAFEGARQARLLHDGRARNVDEAIGWHGGSAAFARERYDHLTERQRQRLVQWVESL